MIFHLDLQVPPWLLDIVNLPVRMPLFFFLSGIFFRQRPFKTFIGKRIKTLVAPFFFFYLLGLIFFLIRFRYFHDLVPEYYADLTYAQILTSFSKIFDLHYDYSPLLGNGVLWFLIALFNIQMIFYGLSHFVKNRTLIFIICLVLSIGRAAFGTVGVSGPFYLPQSFFYLAYYAAGSYLGPKLLDLAFKRFRSILFYSAFALLFLATTYLYMVFKEHWRFLVFFQSAGFIPLVFLFFKSFYKLPVLKPFTFAGQNSIIIFGTQYICMWTFSMLTHNIDFPIPTSLVMLPFVFIVQYLLIKLFTEYTPFLVGK